MEPKSVTNQIRELIRPFISVSFILMTCFGAIKGAIDFKDILEVTGIIVAFHFGERAALKKPEQ